MADMTQYSTAEPFIVGGAMTWLQDPLEKLRLGSYTLYEAIYWGVPQTFQLTTRGTDNDDPIYVPSGRNVIDTIHRYTANDLRVMVDPTIGESAQRAQGQLVLDAFLKRERFYSKFTMNKREGIMRGDWCWHLFADPNLPEGSRISIQTLDPASVFPIYADEDLDAIIGYHIIDQFEFDGKPAIKRLTYRKVTGAGGPSQISVEEAIFKTDAWGGPGQGEENRLQVVQAPRLLPQQIDQLPVYWIANRQQTGTPYGSSEIRGMERLAMAVNQSISDEEMALALEGLGVYATNAGTPVDEDGNEVPWNIGPGRVVELPSGDGTDKTFFNRVQGISTVDPFQAHLKFLLDQMYGTAGTPAIARGSVDVQVAESGIALMLEMGPLLAVAAEKELIITDVHRNMFFDLTKWFAAYDSSLGAPLQGLDFMMAYGPKLPVDPERTFDQVLALYAADIVTLEWALMELTKLGYDFGDVAAMVTAVQAQSAAKAAQAQDAFGAQQDAALAQLNGQGA